MKPVKGLLCGLLMTVMFFTACSGSNVGARCNLTIGQPYCKTNIAELNVASNCDDYWCLSYRGSRPFCSRDCTLDDKCPDGYRCLKQDLSPLDPTINGVFFCVPKSPVTCDNISDCNPQCNGVQNCKTDYICQQGYCQPNSCGAVETDGGTPDASTGDGGV